MRPRTSHLGDVPAPFVPVDPTQNASGKSCTSPPQLSFIEVFLLLEAVRVKAHLLHSPYAVEHISVFRNAQQLVVGGDLVEVGPLLIGEEQIRFPNGVQHGRV